MDVIERVVCHARSSSTPKLQQFRVEARSQPREGVWQAPVSSPFGMKPFQTFKQDSNFAIAETQLATPKANQWRAGFLNDSNMVRRLG
jgi:Tfp pilus assembly protein PilP